MKLITNAMDNALASSLHVLCMQKDQRCLRIYLRLPATTTH